MLPSSRLLNRHPQAEDAAFDPGDVDEESDPFDLLYGRRRMVVVELPGGREVTLPMAVWQQLQAMDRQEALATLRMLHGQQARRDDPESQDSQDSDAASTDGEAELEAE